MFRRAILAGGLALAVASVVRAQEPTAPPVPEDALAPRELIAWSSLQTPQPAQKPLPAIQVKARESNQDSGNAPQQPTGAQAQQDPAQSHNSAQSPPRDAQTQTR
jgi:hypothetical protein